jgi:hypothetical protein
VKLPDDHPVLRLPGPGPNRPYTPDEVNAYLVARGQRLAQDLDLGHVQAQDLYELGRLDVLGQHPALPEGLAVALEMVADKREADNESVDRPPIPPGGEGEGEGDGPGQPPRQPQVQTAPEGAQADSARANAVWFENGQSPGAGQARSVRSVPKSADRNVLLEKNDPDGEEWTT